ncbi:DUF2478 domain-containing protein [Paracoccus indicus]|uniref:DUF2478 domain-containing protein n=1 Tax=Paracoccus indicus TaxID=2079229 RepID=UPI000D377D3D|nr:DUF2478 domain-containing protein [Paracoccus indicus]
MLAWFGLDESAAPGAADRLIADLARDLQARGMRIAGAVQTNHDLGPDCACDMDMQVIGDQTAPVRISQSLGAGASGCRLDTGALEEVVARTAPTLPGAELVIIPKFGRQEAMGRGFYSLIAQAAADGQPVVLYVPRQQRAAFIDFAGDLAVELPPEAVTDWCLGQAAALS